MLKTLASRLIGPDRGRLLFRLVAETAWDFRWRYAAALAAMALVAAMAGAIALTIERVTEEVFFDRNAEAIGWVALWVLAIFAIRGGAMYAQAVILGRVGNAIVARLQHRLYDHVVSQGVGFFTDLDTGELGTRVTHNAAQARAALNMLATRLGADLLTVLTLLGVMIYQDWRLSLVALVGLPAILGGIGALIRRVKSLARAEVRIYARILSGMSETVLGARVVKAFGLEHTMRGRMGAEIDGLRRRQDRIVTLNGLVNPIMETTAGAAAAGVILYGGWRVVNDGLEVGTFFSFLTALLMAGDPARRLAQLGVQLRQHMAGVEFIYATLDRTVRPAEPAGAPPLRVTGGEVAFRDVRFAYPNSEPRIEGEVGAALRGLSFTARAGETTALVGPSGAGKSTVLGLIERFYDSDAGWIEIDGQRVDAVALASLRGQIALVGQDTFLFDATIAENIRFGRPEATDAEVEAAARTANAHDFILATEQGFDTVVGEGGTRLSGGQRQRIAIARAALRDAPILLLDEATSALDAETEARVQDALARLMAGRTTLVVAHRLATVRKAHQIVVMDHGRAVETGTHERLLATGGLYARLARLQFGPTEDAI